MQTSIGKHRTMVQENRDGDFLKLKKFWNKFQIAKKSLKHMQFVKNTS